MEHHSQTPNHSRKLDEIQEQILEYTLEMSRLEEELRTKKQQLTVAKRAKRKEEMRAALARGEVVSYGADWNSGCGGLMLDDPDKL